MLMMYSQVIVVMIIACVVCCPLFADTWSAPVNVSNHPDYNVSASVFGDADGWHYSYLQGPQDNANNWRAWYCTQTASGAWVEPVQIGFAPKCEDSRNSRFSDGTHFVIFQANATKPEWWFTQNSGGGWTTPVTFTPNDGADDLSTSSDKIFDVDSDDTIHLLSQHNDNGVWNMRYYEKTRTGSIMDHGDVFNSGDYQLQGAVKVTGSGANQRVHFQVVSGSSVGAWRCYYRRWNNPGWGPVINLSNLLPISPNGAGAGGIVELPNGRLVACLASSYPGAGDDWEIWLLFSDDNGDTWHSPVNVSQNSGLSRTPSIATNSDGDVIVGWEDNTNGKMQIYARRYRNGRLGRRRILADGFGASIASYGKTTRLAWHSHVNNNWEIMSSENAGADSTAPSAPAFAASASDGKVYLSWTNPGDADVIGTVVRYSTTGYPTSPSDGLPLCDRWADPNSRDTFTHAPVVNGITYYYSAFSYDIGPNYSAVAHASARPAQVSCAAARLYPDSTPADIKGRVITGVFSSEACIYIQDPDSPAGIRVATSQTGLKVGDVVDVTGTVATRTVSNYPADRYIANAVVTDTGLDDEIEPLAMTCLAVGGGPVGSLVPGVKDGVGLNNIGTLVKICGKVTFKSGQYIFVDDGSNIENLYSLSTKVTGVMVKCPSTPNVIVGDIVSVTGIVQGSVPNHKDWTTNRRYIQVRDLSDVRRMN